MGRLVADALNIDRTSIDRWLVDLAKAKQE